MKAKSCVLQRIEALHLSEEYDSTWCVDKNMLSEKGIVGTWRSKLKLKSYDTTEEDR